MGNGLLSLATTRTSTRSSSPPVPSTFGTAKVTVTLQINYNGTPQHNILTTQLTFCQSLIGEASEEIFFKDLDTCAYVLLRACAGLEGEGQPDKAGSAVLDELLSFNQTASNELVEELRDTGNFDDEEGEGGEGGEEGGEEGDGDKDGDDEDEEEEEGDD